MVTANELQNVFKTKIIKNLKISIQKFNFKPVSFVGDLENVRLFANCLVVYDIHHLFLRLIRKFPGNFPSLINKNEKFVEILENYHWQGAEDDIM